jgi:hypothetical protein
MCEERQKELLGRKGWEGKSKGKWKVAFVEVRMSRKDKNPC